MPRYFQMTNRDLHAEVAQIRQEEVERWLGMIKKDPSLLKNFLNWCEDQGHLAEYYDLHIAPVSNVPNESGRYIYYADGYEKEAEATFDDEGNLESLVDDEGNQWRKWAMAYGVLDSKVKNHYLIPM